MGFVPSGLWFGCDLGCAALKMDLFRGLKPFNLEGLGDQGWLVSVWETCLVFSAKPETIRCFQKPHTAKAKVWVLSNGKVDVPERLASKACRSRNTALRVVFLWYPESPIPLN